MYSQLYTHFHPALCEGYFGSLCATPLVYMSASVSTLLLTFYGILYH